MSKFHKFVFCLFFGALMVAQPSYAKLVSTYEQAVIKVKHVTELAINTTNGSVYKAGSSKITNQALRLENQTVRVLYRIVGQEKVITAFKPITEPPFEIPKPPKQQPRHPDK